MKIRQFLFLFLLISALTAAFASFKELLGIAPEDVDFYKSKVMKCKDGSKKFNKEQLNDDFCDCPDGTDEPGTSACPEGKFYCQNAGHSPLILYSSRVNDGICDCCDGSDEYDGRANCPNMCWEAGRVARDKIQKKIATFQEGIAIRKKDTEQAKKSFSRDEAELLKLKNEEKSLKGLVQELKEKKKQIEEAEEKERRIEEEKRLKEAQDKAAEQEKNHTEKHDEVDVFDGMAPEASGQETAEGTNDAVSKDGSEASTDYAGKSEENVGTAADEKYHDASSGTDAVSIDDAKENQEKTDSSEGLSKEDLGRLVASRWTGESDGQKINELGAKKEVDNGDRDISDAANDDDYGGYSSETDEDERRYSNDDMEDNMDVEHEDHEDHDDSYKMETDYERDYTGSESHGDHSWIDKLQQTARNILQTLNLFKSPVNISEAAQIKKEYDESSQKLSKLQSRISSLSEKLKHDFGLEKEFYSFYGHCFENKQNKYVYKVCPFKQASQSEGHSNTQLGRWEKFEDSYRVMLFSHGDKCWNGPDRSLKVRLRCGLKNELADVDEPSRCEYVALLSTPAVCHEERLKELQHKLHLMNSNKPQGHDEL